jgi:hypothetical protein
MRHALCLIAIACSVARAEPKRGEDGVDAAQQAFQHCFARLTRKVAMAPPRALAITVDAHHAVTRLQVEGGDPALAKCTSLPANLTSERPAGVYRTQLVRDQP